MNTLWRQVDQCTHHRSIHALLLVPVRALLISNPNSTSNSARRMPSIVRALRSVDGIRLTSMFTAYPGHAEEMVAGITVRDYDVIISLGGDGTINEIVNGLMDSNPFSALPATELPAIATIPTGSANVLAGALGIPRDPVDAAWYIASLLRSRTRSAISVGHAAERCFLVNAGIGIDAEVISTMEQLRHNGTRAKAVRYLPAIFTAWNELRKSPPQITATIDGKEFGRDLAMAVVSNSNPLGIPRRPPHRHQPHCVTAQGPGVLWLHFFKRSDGACRRSQFGRFLHPTALPLPHRSPRTTR